MVVRVPFCPEVMGLVKGRYIHSVRPHPVLRSVVRAAQQIEARAKTMLHGILSIHVHQAGLFCQRICGGAQRRAVHVHILHAHVRIR